MFRKIRSLFFHFSNFMKMHYQLDRIEENMKQTSYTMLRSSSRHQTHKSLIRYGYKIYSQNDEDGIIREIFNRISVTNRIFIEFGIGNGLENNTLALLFDGWKGLWIEGSKKSIRQIQKKLERTINSGVLSVLHAFITKDNVNKLISSWVDTKEIDLLSIDIDGNDFHVFNAITCINPRVVVIEYNAKFPPPVMFCMRYDESHVWDGSDHFGASIKFLEIEFDKRNYYLVGCNLTGSNAFFVRKDLVGDKFLEPFSAEVHYEPARYYLTVYSSGHKPSFETLEQSDFPRTTYI
jgi:hypothetical protein